MSFGFGLFRLALFKLPIRAVVPPPLPSNNHPCLNQLDSTCDFVSVRSGSARIEREEEVPLSTITGFLSAISKPNDFGILLGK